MDATTRHHLQSVAMRATLISAAAVVALGLVAGATAAALSTHPAHRHTAAAAGPSALSNAITDLQPYAYWPLNTGAFPETDASGNQRPGLTVAGAGGAVQLDSARPPGASGGSVAFNPSGQRRGQYLRSALQPLPEGTIGTEIVWFKLSDTLPGWRQAIIADNGAATGYGNGLFITPGGRLSEWADETPPYAANFGPRRASYGESLADGQWHMAAFVDQYNIDISENGHPRPVADWLPSLVYLDGALVSDTSTGRQTDLMGDPSARLLVGAIRTALPRLGRFAGNIADIALFTRLLTADQIAGVWQAGN